MGASLFEAERIRMAIFRMLQRSSSFLCPARLQREHGPQTGSIYEGDLTFERRKCLGSTNNLPQLRPHPRLRSTPCGSFNGREGVAEVPNQSSEGSKPASIRRQQNNAKGNGGAMRSNPSLMRINLSHQERLRGAPAERAHFGRSALSCSRLLTTSAFCDVVRSPAVLVACRSEFR